MAKRSVIVSSFVTTSKESFIDKEIRETAEREEMWKNEKLKKEENNKAGIGKTPFLAQDTKKNGKQEPRVLSRQETHDFEQPPLLGQTTAAHATLGSEEAEGSHDDIDEEVQRSEHDTVKLKDGSIETIQNGLVTEHDKKNLLTQDEDDETLPESHLDEKMECRENLSSKITTSTSNHEVLSPNNIQQEQCDLSPILVEEEDIIPVKLPRKLITDNIQMLEDISDNNFPNSTTGQRSSNDKNNQANASMSVSGIKLDDCSPGEPNDEGNSFEKTSVSEVHSKQKPDENTNKISSNKECLLGEDCEEGTTVGNDAASTATILLEEDGTEKFMKVNFLEGSTIVGEIDKTENIVETISTDETKKIITEESSTVHNSSTSDKIGDGVFEVPGDGGVSQHCAAGISEPLQCEDCKSSIEQEVKSTPSMMSQTSNNLFLTLSPRGWGSKSASISPATPKLKFKQASSLDGKAEAAETSRNINDAADVENEKTKETGGSSGELLPIDRNNFMPRTGNVTQVIVTPQRSGHSFEVVSSKSRQHTIMQLEIAEAQLREQEWRQNLVGVDADDIIDGKTVSVGTDEVEIGKINFFSEASEAKSTSPPSVKQSSAGDSERELNVSKEPIEKISPGESSEHQKKTVVEANRVMKRKCTMAQRWEAGKFANKEDS